MLLLQRTDPVRPFTTSTEANCMAFRARPDPDQFSTSQKSYIEIDPNKHNSRYWLANMLGNALGRWEGAAKHMKLAADGGYEKAKGEVAAYQAKAVGE